MRVRVRMAWCAALMLLPAPGAQSQGYYSGYDMPRSGFVSPYIQPYGMLPYRPSRPPSYLGRPYWSEAWRELGGAPYERPATYRTLCVRTCDGYYFPISFATTSAGFAQDAETCSARCGSDARLFYHPNPGGDVETMTDLTGLAYAQLPNAFKYRKTLVDGCQCRPQPWSEAERARHRAYAQRAADQAEASRLAAQQQAGGDRAASRMLLGAPPVTEYRDYTLDPQGGAPRASAVDDRRVVERPQPVDRDMAAGTERRWTQTYRPVRPYRY